MEIKKDNNIIEVHTDTVYCDGGKLGHPRVFLTFEENKIECPYCGQIFIKV
ncbi:MAG: hypothetical protein CMM49_09515 [Rhodospirillaceae bacterium]|nr:hypothetical protein [Rhodospirillaceae bacterium]|tara:strand:+ start:208 stop:360 length:153 start_codon:yes stop_codon:yes gene_type:complete